MYPVVLLKVDDVTGEPLRDERGLCIEAGGGEVGEMASLIQNTASRAFDGYVDKKATESKIVIYRLPLACVINVSLCVAID